MYRQQAEQTDDPIVKNELLELAPLGCVLASPPVGVRA
jgi:hypothetical protein